MRRGSETVCVNCGAADVAAAPSALPNGNGVQHPQHYSSEEEAGIEAAPPPLRQRLLEAAAGGGGGPARAAPPAGDEDATQLIADRMLEGWCLLADHCPL